MIAAQSDIDVSWYSNGGAAEPSSERGVLAGSKQPSTETEGFNDDDDYSVEISLPYQKNRTTIFHIQMCSSFDASIFLHRFR